MRTINVGPGMLAVSEISLGCMRIHTLEPAALDKLLGRCMFVWQHGRRVHSLSCIVQL